MYHAQADFPFGIGFFGVFKPALLPIWLMICDKLSSILPRRIIINSDAAVALFFNCRWG
jgi:hypothetical protein